MWALARRVAPSRRQMGSSRCYELTRTHNFFCLPILKVSQYQMAQVPTGLGGLGSKFFEMTLTVSSGFFRAQVFKTLYTRDIHIITNHTLMEHSDLHVDTVFFISG